MCQREPHIADFVLATIAAGKPHLPVLVEAFDLTDHVLSNHGAVELFDPIFFDLVGDATLQPTQPGNDYREHAHGFPRHNGCADRFFSNRHVDAPFNC